MSREELSKSEKYIIQHFAHEDQDLVRVHQKLVSDNKYGINVSPAEGKLLQVLVGIIQPKIIVEVGTLYGYSTLWMAKALPAGGKIISLEHSQDHYGRALEHFKKSEVADKIILHLGDAREILPTLNVTPDLVFIDADKPGYRHYLDWAMTNVRVGGVILGDNTFLFGHMTGEDRGQKTSAAAIDSMKYFNETLATAENYRAAMIPTFEGMTIAQRLK
jgi:predicted O-methyltransferase YrrM